MMGYLDSDFDGMTLTVGRVWRSLHGVNVPLWRIPPFYAIGRGGALTAGERAGGRGQAGEGSGEPSTPDAVGTVSRQAKNFWRF